MLGKTALVALLGMAAATEALSIHEPRHRAITGLTARQSKAGNKGGANNQAGGANNQAGGNNAQSSQCLDPQVVATGSASTGLTQGVDPKGQSDSKTYVLRSPRAAGLIKAQIGVLTWLLSRDSANFINFCASTGQQITNGLQQKQGSCNPIGTVLLAVQWRQRASIR